MFCDVSTLHRSDLSNMRRVEIPHSINTRVAYIPNVAKAEYILNVHQEALFITL